MEQNKTKAQDKWIEILEKNLVVFALIAKYSGKDIDIVRIAIRKTERETGLQLSGFTDLLIPPKVPIITKPNEPIRDDPPRFSALGLKIIQLLKTSPRTRRELIIETGYSERQIARVLNDISKTPSKYGGTFHKHHHGKKVVYQILG